MSTPAPKRLMKKKGPSLAPVIAAVTATVLFAAAVGGYFGLCAWVKNNGLLLPGTTVAGLPDGQTVDLSGMDADSAAALLDSHLDAEIESRALTVAYDGKTARLEGELLAADAQAPVASAMEDKLSRPFYALGLSWLGMGRESEHSLSALSLSETGRSRVDLLAEQIAREMYVAPVDDAYEIAEESVELTRGTDGREVDKAALARDMTDALLAGEERMEVESEPLPAAPITGQELSQVVYAAPKNPARAEDGSITAPVMGRSIDPAEAQSILDATAPGETCSIPMTLTRPDFGDPSLLYQDKLSTMTTYITGTANRKNNVKLAANEINGTILLPGEVFSFNDTVGQRTAERGYKTATVYVGGEDKQELGGGICHVASAVYYCTLYANLEIVSRANHRFAVPYVPYGLDATVAWPSLDYKFRNDRNYPIKIEISFDNKWNMTVDFYGTKEDDRYVKMETNELSATPYETVYQIDWNLSAGQTKDLVSPYTGYKYESYRCVYDGSGKQISRTFEASSKYASRNKVTAVSPYDAAQYGLEGGITTPAPTESTAPEITPPPAISQEPAPSIAPLDPVPSQDPTPVSPDVWPDPWQPDVPAEPSPTPGNAIPDWITP